MTWILKKIAFAAGLALSRALIRAVKRRRDQRRALEPGRSHRSAGVESA
ncbi:hypothetical protein GCM10009830_42030 [Glycomyces endophyticus]|uniref:Uncharacterized protein n=1 Tax=Glycomyces endophyticus TaxID=480996 RepID=A0ABN2HLM6_9ACTN